MSKPDNRQPLQPLKGELATLLQDDFKKSGDFLYYEGPLLSHFVNLRNEDFIIKWCGTDSQFNRWLLYKTNHELLRQFFTGTIGDLELALATPDKHVYFIDIDNDINWRNIVKVELADIPSEYLPEPTAFYEPGDFEPYAEKLHAYLDLHLARRPIPYKIPESPALLAAEPPQTGYGLK